MYRSILSFCFILGLYPILAQAPLDSAAIASQTHYFTLDRYLMEGSGADILRREMETNQFFLLGEYHHSSQISLLTKALLYPLTLNGYRFLGVETGPIAARKLTDLARESDQTQAQLKTFLDQYLLWDAPGEMPDEPLPFFSGVEDAAFLAEASKYDFELWGLDQEYYYSAEWLFEEIFLLRGNYKVDSLKLQADYENARHFVRQETQRELQSEMRYPLLSRFQESDTIRRFFAHFPSHPPAQEVILALQKSWEIYQHNEKGRWYANNNERAKYMKQNFYRNYLWALNKWRTLPKVFVKMGGMHLGRGASWLEVYDLGNLVTELADMNQTSSVHITCLNRYYRTEEAEEDALEGNRDSAFAPLLAQARRDAWTLIELRPFLETVFYRGKVRHQTNPTLEHLIKSFDYVLIPPVDQPQAPNYSPWDE